MFGVLELLILLSIIAYIGSPICWIIVLTKLFPAEGVGKGLLGILCGLYPFVWGWLHKDEHNLQKVMLIWSILVVLGIVSMIVFQSAG